MATKRYRTADLLRWAALGACRVQANGVELVFERPGYVRPKPPEPTESERAELAVQRAEIERQLWDRPFPIVLPEPTSAEWWDAFVRDQQERTAHWSPATWAAWRLHQRRDRVRYGLRRLRTGSEYRWQRPLALVRAEAAAALRELGHARLARVVEGDAMPAQPRPSAVQMELGL